jgi:flagellar motility protein MotE (MotC chaperone)
MSCSFADSVETIIKSSTMMNPEDHKKENGETPPVKEADAVPTFSENAVNGFLDNFKMELNQVSQELKSLTDKQTELLEEVSEHNEVMQSSPELSQLIKLMEEMKGGMDRLSRLRHDMTVVHDRSEKLKNRAEKLETVCKSAQKKEEDLVAKMDKSSTSTSDQ